MKKILFCLVSIFFITTSCNNKDDDGDTTPPLSTTQIVFGTKNDLEKYNVPKTIPINYFGYKNMCIIPDDENSIKLSNVKLNEFYQKYTFVNVEKKEITHTSDGIAFVSEEHRLKYLRKPLKFEVDCRLTMPVASSENIIYGLIEKERIVAFYTFKSGIAEYKKGDGYLYETSNFYVFPTDEAYREYLSILKSIHYDPTEIYKFVDAHKPALPLVLLGFRDEDIPDGVPRSITYSNNNINSHPFTFYNSENRINELNERYEKTYIGKYRFEPYNKWEYVNAGQFMHEPIVVENLEKVYEPNSQRGDEYLTLYIGGIYGRGVKLDNSTRIKLMEEKKIISFYWGGFLNAFILFPNTESYKEYEAILKDIIKNKPAQDLIFIR